MKNKTNPEFEGKPLYKIDFSLLRNNDFGKEITSRVNERLEGTKAEIKKDYIGKKNQPITNSSTFRLFAINQAARELDARVLHPEEIQYLRLMKELPEAGKAYYDLGAILDFSGNYHNLAVRLFETLPKQDLGLLPALMLELDVEKSSSVKEGLELLYGKYSQLRTSKILSGKTGNYESSDLGLLVEGIPLKLGKGELTLYIAKQLEPVKDNLGLVGFCLHWGGDLGWDGKLWLSYPGGRVGMRNAAGVPQNFTRKIADDFKIAYDAEVSRLISKADRIKKIIEEK